MKTAHSNVINSARYQRGTNACHTSAESNRIYALANPTKARVQGCHLLQHKLNTVYLIYFAFLSVVLENISRRMTERISGLNANKPKNNPSLQGAKRPLSFHQCYVNKEYTQVKPVSLKILACIYSFVVMS